MNHFHLVAQVKLGGYEIVLYANDDIEVDDQRIFIDNASQDGLPDEFVPIFEHEGQRRLGHALFEAGEVESAISAGAPPEHRPKVDE